MKFIRILTEIKDFQHSKKRASFRIVFTTDAIDEESPLEELAEDSEEFLLVLEEKKKEFSLRDIHDSYEEEIGFVIDRIPNSVVLFFRLGSLAFGGEGIYINIIYNWLGKWKDIIFSTTGFTGFFKKKAELIRHFRVDWLLLPTTVVNLP